MGTGSPTHLRAHTRDAHLVGCKIRCIAQRRSAKLVSSAYLRYLRWYLGKMAVSLLQLALTGIFAVSSLLQLTLTGIFAVSSEDTRRYHISSTPCFHTPLTLRPPRSARSCTARRTTLANLHVHRSARGLLQGRPDWCAAVGRAVRVHGGLSRHGAPPPRPNPTDSLGFAVQRAAPTPDIGAQHAEKSSCLRQTVLRGPFP